MVDILFNLITELDNYNEIIDEKNSKLIIGLSGAQNKHFVVSLAKQLKRPFLFVSMNETAIKTAIQDFQFFLNDEIEYFPAEDLFFKSEEKSKDIFSKRSKIFEKILNKKKPNIITTANALIEKLPLLKEYKKEIIKLKLGDTYNIDKLISELADVGYERVDMVEGVAEFSVRGGIVDFYSPESVNPIRIEFFDDEIDSIREFDIMTQRTIQNLRVASVMPVKSNEVAGESSFLEYLSKDYLIFVEEPMRMVDRIDQLLFEYGERFSDDTSKIDLFNKEAIFELLDEMSTYYLSPIDIRLDMVRSLHKISIPGREIASNLSSMENLIKNIKEWIKSKNRVIILAGTDSKVKNLIDTLKSDGITNIVKDVDNLQPGEVVVTNGYLSAGFEYPSLNTIIISEKEVFGFAKRKTKSVKDKKKIKIKVDDLKIGDYIVHEKHGIGIYLGIETLDAGGIVNDYIKISYANDSTLYVSINQLDNVSKYIGAEGKKPRLSKMGGADFAKAKLRVKSGVENIAKQLVELYAKREASEGFAFSKDTVWQQEFEQEFIYQETDDQLRCIDEVKRDMEKTRPMDRLLCGDVGYGKTEVAIRASFKAVMDSKQVAYLAPTTVLASQHYKSFTKRMKDYPIKIEYISRLKSKQEQKRILERLKKGEIDILIGTHRILQKDIIFKDLGLLIVDEEQKFGVMDKERIKMMKENLDVLTLTATPIPRTLHMSMVGVKDVSVIYEPPKNRNPIQTYVFEYDEGIIREAIRREIERGGQVFFLHNKVEDIDRVAGMIAKALPDVKVRYAHGKMEAKELEDIMLSFEDGEFDVLVCTTIIESGLDIPNVNTIIIENSDRLGLSQLYQLRGRVGRSDRIAYAYITYKKDKSLSEIAQKRLKAMRDFTEFGSGFKIAMRDLEIRGAGSLIGAEQHGHMDVVGYETYCKILAQTIREMKGEIEEKKEEINIDIPVNAYISEKYISNEVQKIEMYQKISRIVDEEDLRDVIDEFNDRFGDIPNETYRLLDVAELKYLASSIGIKSISKRSKNIILEFGDKNKLDINILGEIATKYKGKMLFSAGANPYITLKDIEDDEIRNVKILLQNVIELHSVKN